MPFNGSGTFLRVRSWIQDAAANIRIHADRHDSEDDNFAQGLSQCITKDGQTTITANLPMANYRHTNVGAATGINQYARYDQMQLGKAVWAAASGTADAITATYNPNTSSPVDGQLYYVRASAANATTTPTFSPDGTTAQLITKYGAEPLVAGDISGAGHELILRYRLADTKYELLNPATSTKLPSLANAWTPASSISSASLDFAEDTDNGTNKVKLQAPQSLASDVTVTLPETSGTLLLSSQVPVLRNFIDGYIMSTAGASSTITIGAGQAADTTNSVYLSGPSISKTTSSWAVGNAQGGLDAGTIANNTWYRFYAIRRPDTGVVDVVFSVNGSTPTLPTNYTQYAPLWWWRTNASSQWENITQRGNTFWHKSIKNMSSTVNSTRTLIGIPVPANSIAKITFSLGAAASAYVLIQSPIEDDAVPSVTLNDLSTYPSLLNAGSAERLTNSSSQLAFRSDTPVSGVIRTIGWIDTRD